ncbi:MAG: 16S rRNA (adenine(1518)-N(6)/adenine(1519)-N(6))-dimethyltransferase RsmA [Elusimicrobiota bacterium]|jgi:16S rRNA (adenine1518-N6/adenine1519-N6)-dimethyltransferase
MPRYDQHFLASEKILDLVIRAVDPRPGEEVLEIGPGRGVMSMRLLAAGVRLKAVEIDSRMALGLRGRFAGHPDFELIEADFLETDLGALGRPHKVVGNLPYSVATPILQRLLGWRVDGPGEGGGIPWSLAVLMFQKEVVDRILAGPGSRDYGLLSLSVRMHAEAEEICRVPPSSFSPPPKVDSAVVRLIPRTRPFLPADLSEQDFFRIGKGAFMHRRKKASKSLSMALGLSKDAVEKAFACAELPPDVRAEDIPPESFIALSRALAPGFRS